MDKMRFVLFFLILFLNKALLSQISSFKLTPGIYKSYDKTRMHNGHFLIKSDSTFLFLGLSNAPVNPCFTLYRGNWYTKGEELYMRFSDINDENYMFKNSSLIYQASTQPSYDSIYFNIIISNEFNINSEIPIIIGNKIINSKNGIFKGAFAINEITLVNKLIIPEAYMHVSEGGYYRSEIVLNTNFNSHTIKIQLPFFSKIPLISFGALLDWQSYKFSEQKKDSLKFMGGLSLIRESNFEELDQLAHRAKKENPSFVNYIDKIVTEFKIKNHENNY